MKIIKTGNFKKSKLEKLKPFLDLNFVSPKIVLAGGCLRTLINNDDKIEDYDLFFLCPQEETIKNKSDLESVIIDLGGKKTFQCKEDTLRTFSLNGLKIQFICLKEHLTTPDLLLEFDICASIFAFDGTHLYFAKEAVKDNRMNHISVNKITFAVASLQRICKFNRKGFKTTLAAQEFVQQVAANSENMDIDTVYID